MNNKEYPKHKACNRPTDAEGKEICPIYLEGYNRAHKNGIARKKIATEAFEKGDIREWEIQYSVECQLYDLTDEVNPCYERGYIEGTYVASGRKA